MKAKKLTKKLTLNKKTIANLTIDELKKVYIARYDGQTWTKQQVNDEGFLNDIWGSPDGQLFAVGGNLWSSGVWPSYNSEAVILHSEDGFSWESMNNNFDRF